MVIRHIGRLGLGLMVLVLIGCGGPQLAKVSGKVSFRGQPLKEGTITFYPEKGRPANGKIKDGVIIDVTTNVANDGGTVGMNKVAVQAVTNANDMYAKHQSLIPESYGKPEQSGLTATLNPGANELTFDLP